MNKPMYTPPTSRAASAYRRVHVETRMSEADPHQVVSLLFDGLLQSLATARGAMQRGDVAEKCNAIAKSVRIIEEGLKTGLDLENGGELAQNLEGLYGYCVVRLALANAHNDESVLQEVTGLITEIAHAWNTLRTSGDAHPSATGA